jgi:hypothetical protein
LGITARHSPMTTNAILRIQPLGFPWATIDPFLFCVHHDDAYPRGNGHFGPDAPLTGRQLGQDFAGLDGWRMYHGMAVPGFPFAPAPRLRDRDHRAARARGPFRFAGRHRTVWRW